MRIIFFNTRLIYRILPSAVFSHLTVFACWTYDVIWQKITYLSFWNSKFKLFRQEFGNWDFFHGSSPPIKSKSKHWYQQNQNIDKQGCWNSHTVGKDSMEARSRFLEYLKTISDSFYFFDPCPQQLQTNESVFVIILFFGFEFWVLS